MSHREVLHCQDLKCENTVHLQQIDSWCKDLVNVCLTSDVVLPHKNRGKKIVPGWKTTVKPYRDNNRFWYNTWKRIGKPKNGHIYEYMKEARRDYMYAIRRAKRRDAALRNESLAQAVSSGRSRDFFREIKRINHTQGTLME